MTNESSSIMERLKQIEPIFMLRIALFVAFAGYYDATGNADTGMVAFYIDFLPIVGKVMHALFPFAFMVGMGILMIGRDDFPITSILVASIPQIIYASFSGAWFLVKFPDISTVAISTHISIAIIILAFVFAEVRHGHLSAD